MKNAFQTFNRNLVETREMFSCYEFLEKEVKLPCDRISDFLRFQIVYAVSALDRFIHEIIRVGCIESLHGRRLPTEKFASFSIKLSNQMNLIMNEAGTMNDISSLQSEFIKIVCGELSDSLAHVSFQSSTRIKEGLSFIWVEQQKFAKLAQFMTMSSGDVEQMLNLLVTRRNQIAHEADIDPVSSQKRDITVEEVQHALSFIENFACAIYNVVTNERCYLSQ